MNAIRNIVDVIENKVTINIPEVFKSKRVEVIILPVENSNEDYENEFNPEEYIGTLNLKNVEESIKDLRDEWNR